MTTKQILDRYIRREVISSPGNFNAYERHKKNIGLIARGDAEWYTYACRKISRKIGI